MDDHLRSDFDERWRSLDREKRREIAGLANAGKTSRDPQEAALVAEWARRRMRPIEASAMIVAAVVGYVIAAQLFLDGPEPLVIAGLVVAVAIYLAFQRRRLSAAITESEKRHD